MNQHVLLVIPRALQAWSKFKLIDDREGNQFKAVVWRPYTGQATPKFTPQVGTQPESRPESQPESLEGRVLHGGTPIATEISVPLGQREVSGHFNKVILSLLDERSIELTVPDKPQSWLKKYRLVRKSKDFYK